LHSFYKFFFFRKRFFRFPKQNLHYIAPENVKVETLAELNDCEIFIDEGQWLFDSYAGKENVSQAKRKLILHTRHLNRSLNIISQRPMAVQKTARAQVNRFYKCEKKMAWPFLIFTRTEFQDLADETVDETDPISKKTYFARKKVLNAYDSKYLRAGVERSQELYIEAYDYDFKGRFNLLKDNLFTALKSSKQTPMGGNKEITGLKKGVGSILQTPSEVDMRLPF